MAVRKNAIIQMSLEVLLLEGKLTMMALTRTILLRLYISSICANGYLVLNKDKLPRLLFVATLLGLRNSIIVVYTC